MTNQKAPLEAHSLQTWEDVTSVVLAAAPCGFETPTIRPSSSTNKKSAAGGMSTPDETHFLYQDISNDMYI